jgi:alpha-D-ribose 1-methylphosphonate 5-triphosphate diphosphatase
VHVLPPMTEILSNAVIVTPETTVRGTVVVRDGRIAEISRQSTAAAGAADLDGDLLLPGLIDLHTDNLERHFFPRPGVHWPSPLGAVLAHDRDVIGAGITTVLDALSCGDYESGGARRTMLNEAISTLSRAKQSGLLAADHLLHLRCETSDAHVLDIVEPHVDNPLLALLSVMDHTPGQRQWRDLEIYRNYRRTKKNIVWTDAEFAEHIARVAAFRDEHAARFARRIQEIARTRSIALASHDDTTLDDVEESAAAGITISEFPTTFEAAERAHARGQAIAMGSPNVVLGRSHSGNVGAADLHARGLVDMLCSDYVPASLLESVFYLVRAGTPLPRAANLASRNVADALGLDDRGAIEVGRRADLIRIRLVDGHPVLRGVWREGRPVLIGSGLH